MLEHPKEMHMDFNLKTYQRYYICMYYRCTCIDNNMNVILICTIVSAALNVVCCTCIIHCMLTLFQLMEFRGQERTSLLDFLVQQLHIKKPDLLSMPTRLEAVAKASESQLCSCIT